MSIPHRSTSYLRVGLWFLASIVLGSMCSAIRWGTEDRFHGTGFPIPIVMWDKPPGGDQFIDYVSFAGLILNPLFVFLTGLFYWGLWSVARWTWRRVRG
ncbi:hypothetical protein DES53_11913 [Roseimicrobium gellanilyticum]|uniref:Uncharacterized protein n=1 Tax=Roseimicrobium gellanilyticum TaxID=748857 RepID=A0A366H4R8_9BACT|nr:hypothetical protein [Roseimicrobium gellanilyticum]RBP35847.1 hypothetical protein DES53_11913 [Roseimicrobium gellanilyticum]